MGIIVQEAVPLYVTVSLMSNVPILQHMSQTDTSYCSSHCNHTCK